MLYREFKRSCNSQSSDFNPSKEGFTLIEVIVAVAIMAVSLVMIMQLFSGGLKIARASCDYTRAVIHAKDKMEELSAAPLHFQNNGEFSDGFRWVADARIYEDPAYEELEDKRFNLLKLKVKVIWSSAFKKETFVELETLKMVTSEDAENL